MLYVRNLGIRMGFRSAVIKVVREREGTNKWSLYLSTN